MSNQNFPALGFNPAPGHLESVDDLTGKLDAAMRSLSSAHSVLHRLGRGAGVWEGEAARAFAGQVGDLPKYVSDSRDAMRDAATQLKSWHTALASYQHKGRQYEADAAAAKNEQKTRTAEHERAEAAYNKAASDPALSLAGQYYTSKTELDSAQAKIDAASDRLDKANKTVDLTQKRLDSATSELESIIKKAEDLLDNHQDEARSIASRIRKATEGAPTPGFWEGLGDAFTRLGHSIQNWCTKHADLLKSIGDALSIASSILGVASLLTLWCPPLAGALALAGGALSVGALAAHGAAKLGGADVGVMDLVGDGLGVLPVGKFAGAAARGVKVGMKVTRIEGQAVKSIDKVKKIEALKNAGFEGKKLEGTTKLGRPIVEGTERFSAKNLSLGNRAKLAWTSHVQDTVGASIKEAGLSKGLTKVMESRFTPTGVKDSLGAALRADGSIDPLSWWSKGPQVAQQVPGIAIDAHTALTSPGTPAAGRL
ncbi:putative T7SS-secreted protein [Streptomyces sp. NPDC048637]|uniref:putative T7SS-secreted protein n=1 Tax=Streptomyces sp. NPDC048637 TaxID=3155636 RepID=UPI003429B6F1